jgi:hypothetical protein
MIKKELLKENEPLLKYNLQYFADKGGGDGSDDAGDGDDNQDKDGQDDDPADEGSDDKSKKSDKKKYFTQAELDEAIKKRLKREREKAEKQQTAKKDDKSEDNSADKKAAENNEKLTALEEKVLCYDHDIAKEYVREAIALAKAYIDDDTDMDEALEKVTKKFPQFVKGSGKKKDDDDDDDEDETDNRGSWGQRQKGSSKKTDGVEAAFLRKNPGLKID